MTSSAVSHFSLTPGAIGPGQALAFAGAVGPTLSVFVPKAIAPLFFLVAVAELTLFWHEHRRLPVLPPAATGLFAAFVIWGVIGASWSLSGAASLVTAGKLAIMALLGLPLLTAARELPPAARLAALRFTTGGVIAGIFVLAIEVLFEMPLTHLIYAALGRERPIYTSMLNQAATVLVLLATIVVGDVLSRKHIVRALPLGLAAAILAIVSDSAAAGLAAGLAAIVFVAIYWCGPVVGRGLAIFVAAAVLLAPWLTMPILRPVQELQWPDNTVPSVYQRIAIWKFAAQRIGERPILGWGLDASRRIPGGQDGIRADSLHIQNPIMRERVAHYLRNGNVEQLPLHPHDSALQIWLEGGSVGAILTAALIFIALSSPIRDWAINRSAAAASFACAMAALTMSAVSYGIWQTWWLALLWLSAVFAAVLLGVPGKRGVDGQRD